MTLGCSSDPNGEKRIRVDTKQDLVGARKDCQIPFHMDWHLNHGTNHALPEYPATIETRGTATTDKHYRVEKMKFGPGKDKTVIIYNAFITVRGIPLEAYEYVVNGKSAIEWVMERQCVSTDKDSGIVKDANDWAVETMGDPRYPLSLLLRVITVSLETIKIVKSLPELEILL